MVDVQPDGSVPAASESKLKISALAQRKDAPSTNTPRVSTNREVDDCMSALLIHRLYEYQRENCVQGAGAMAF